MENPTTYSTLHTGLLSIDRKLLMSPNPDYPELFTDPFDRDRLSSVESQARLALGTRGIMASTERILMPRIDTNDRGYLLREASRINPDDHGLTTFTQDEVQGFAEAHDEQDVRIHYLLQAAHFMRSPR